MYLHVYSFIYGHKKYNLDACTRRAFLERTSKSLSLWITCYSPSLIQPNVVPVVAPSNCTLLEIPPIVHMSKLSY